jgi:hypothetical protein
MSWEIVEDSPLPDVAESKPIQRQPEIRETPLLDQFTSGRANQFLNNFINQSAMERAVAGSVGGVTTMAAGERNAEEALPFVMGTIGGVLGAKVGHPNLGVGIGVGVGDAEKQFIDLLKGEAEKTNLESSFLKGAGAGLLGKATESVFKIGGMTFNLVPERARVAFYDKVRQGADLGYKALVRNYGRAVDKIVRENPNTRIALNETMEQIGKAVEGVVDDAGQPILPQIKRAVSNNPRLKDVVEDPSKAIGLTLKEAQELKSAISSTVKPLIKRVQKGGTATPQERNIFEILNSFDKNITKAFPQMRQVNEIYHTGKDAYNLARPLLERGKAVESSLMSKPEGLFGLGGTKFMGSTGGKLALKDTLGRIGPTGEKLYKAAELSHNLNRAADAVGRIAEIEAGRRILGNTIGKLGSPDEGN